MLRSDLLLTVHRRPPFRFERPPRLPEPSTRRAREGSGRRTRPLVAALVLLAGAAWTNKRVRVGARRSSSLLEFRRSLVLSRSPGPGATPSHYYGGFASHANLRSR